jgi:glycosyltransferase involved in cell wall biosynthesis
MKFLFIVEHYFPYIGGAETLWKNLSDQLVDNNHEVTVITTRFHKNLKKQETLNGVKIIRLAIPNRFLFTILSVKKCIEIAKTVDLIQTSTYTAAIPAFIASKVTKTKCVITFHEYWGKLWFKVPFTSLFSKFMYFSFEWFILKLKFDKFIAVSDFTKSRLIEAGINQNNIKRIYNGLEYSHFNVFNLAHSNQFTFCYFGRLGVSKGLDVLLEGFSIFILKHPGVKLKMIVPNYPKSIFLKIRELAKTLKIDTNIIWKHNLSDNDLMNEIISTNAVIIPSLSEGFCFTAAETVALKMPVISSEKGALKEVTGGKIITIESLSPEGLNQALESAFRCEWDEKEVTLFPLDTTVKQYQELYELTLNCS